MSVLFVISRWCFCTVHWIFRHLSQWHLHLHLYCYWSKEWDHNLESGWKQWLYPGSWHTKCHIFMWTWKCFNSYRWDWVWDKWSFLHINTEWYCNPRTEWHTCGVPWQRYWNRIWEQYPPSIRYVHFSAWFCGTSSIIFMNMSPVD